MSKFIGFIVGAIEIGIGIATGNVALIVSGTLTIVAQAVVDLTAPKIPAREASETTLQLGEQPRSALFGEMFTAGSLVDGFDYGGKYATDWEVLVIRLADHKCDSLTGFYVNDVFVPYVGDGNYPQFDEHHFSLWFRSDTSTQALPSVVTSNGPGWTSDDTGDSGCDVVVAYLADLPDAKHPAWPGGRPHFGFVVKGKLCYDPRLDGTAGGTGAHRWDDPSTWEWSENPAVCRYNWVRGIYANDAVGDSTALLVGRGLSAAEAPPTNIFSAANLCDESVDSGVRYRIAGPVYSNQQFLEVEEMFAVATAGSVVTHEGSVELEPGQSKSVVATITDDDLLVGSTVSWNERLLSESDEAWVNSVVANYVEPDQQWQAHDAPVVRSSADIISDNGPKEASITLRLVKDVDQAQRIAEIQRRLGRLWGRASVVLGPRFCELEAGDWISWQSDRRFGGDTITFRIEANSIDEKWQNTLTLREISSDVFDGVYAPDTDYSDATPTTPPIDVGEPDGGNWALAAVTLTDSGVSTPALRITGDSSDDGSVGAIIFEYWKDDGIINPVTDPDDPTWTVFGTLPPSTTKVDIPGIEGGEDYFAAVTYVVSGIPGDRLVLGPVTAGSTDISGAVNPLVTTALNGLSWKQCVRAATTANGTLASAFENGDAIDGVTLATGDRVLLKNQSAGAENGIYVVAASGAPTRATDADSAAELVCATVKVSEGTANADTEWTCTTNAPITVNTTALVWATPTGGSFTAASTTEVLTGTDSSKGATPDSVAALWEQGADVASAGTTSLDEGGYFNITGTTTITDIDFATDKAGRKAWVKFGGILTLTHNASTLILPTGANITTAAGDTACFVSEGSDVVRCVAYNRASGAALASSGGSGAWVLAGTGQTATGIWDQAVDGSKANVDFVGLAGFTDIMIITKGITKGTTGVTRLLVSINNGSTFYNTAGDYVFLPTTGAETNDSIMGSFHGVNSTAARSGWGMIPGAGGTGFPKPWLPVTEGSGTGRLFVASTSPINAVRINGSGGGNLTGGKIYCLAR